MFGRYGIVTQNNIIFTLKCQFVRNCIYIYMVAGAAALAAETRKHIANDKKCQELGWACVPIAVETYSNWGQETKQTLSQLASRLATDSSQPKSKVIADLNGRLNLTLMRAIARAILARAFWPIVLLN